MGAMARTTARRQIAVSLTGGSLASMAPVPRHTAVPDAAVDGSDGDTYYDVAEGTAEPACCWLGDGRPSSGKVIRIQKAIRKFVCSRVNQKSC